MLTKTIRSASKFVSDQMDTKTNFQPTNHQFPRKPLKGERRVRFADSMGMELVSIFLFDIINTYYFASFHSQKKALQAPPSHQALKSSQHSYSTHNNNNNNSTGPTAQSQPPPPPILQSSATHIALPAPPRSSLLSSSRSSSASTTTTTTNYSAPTATLTSALAPASQLHHQQYLRQQQQLQQQQRLAQQQLQQQQQQPNQARPPQFVCEFTQPISLISFKERVRISKVHLETCQVNFAAGHVSVTCTIRVLNQSFEKSVIVRYTTDEWHTFTDSLASYRPGSCDGWSDKFTATFSLTNQVKDFQPGQRIVFAIKYAHGSADNVHWDNNGGLNYSIKRV